MNPITHFFVGWVALERSVPSNRDKALVCLSGVAPDLDGIGIIIDFGTRSFRYPETDFYQEYHRLLGHGLPAAFLIAGLASAFAGQRVRVALLAFVAVHLHFVCDILGSRGTTAEDLWPITYLAPIAAYPEIVWNGQWPLVGWQNLLVSAILMLWIMNRATHVGYSPVALLSRLADVEFVKVLRKWRLSFSLRSKS